MSIKRNSRRKFLQLTGAGLAGATLTVPSLASAFAVPAVAAGISPNSGNDKADSGTYNVQAFGAKGDGKAIDTPAVNKAIEAAAAAGGGVVDFPAGASAGFYSCMDSKVALHLETRATTLAADSAA